MTCYHPINIKVKNEYQTVPCSRCIGCRLERSRQWAIRCVHESQYHKVNAFVTLTYKEDELTWGLNRPTLVPRDLQLFWKRLRKKYGSNIRYFACGEYGGVTNRPHYHACIFGLDFQDKKLWSIKNNNRLYRSDSLDNLWTHGGCLIGDVTFESAAYVARYIVSKRLGDTSDYYENEGIEPEFIRMSRRPGIGKKWLDKYMSDIFPADRVIIRNGQKCTPPKYYSLQYELQNPEKFKQLKIKRINNQINNSSNSTKSRLLTRETVKYAQIKSLTRNL